MKVVALTGAGISAESGIATFRDSGGLWEGYDVMDVASPQGWERNPEMVLNFYNERRKAALKAQPNLGHKALAKMEEHFDVTVITQNVDNLHEKAGSSKVIHLHGQLFQCRSTADESLVYDMDHWELKMGDLCDKGSQLRPHIVWFGEMVPMMEEAARIAGQADIFLVIGTSLVVYPAAGLVDCAPHDCQVYVVDPNLPVVGERANIQLIEEKASVGVEKLRKQLVEKYG